MMQKRINYNAIIPEIKNGAIGILPTDTLYGLVGSAINKNTVERIYKIRKRAPEKPMIILISSMEYLNKFSIHPTEKITNFLKKLWPNSVSIILTCEDENFEYLHRGTKTLAFRIPNKSALLNLLSQTGPLVAPSANFEGEKPAHTIKEAKNYFGSNVDFYIDAGRLDYPPSTLIKIEDDKITVLRQGSFKLKEHKIS